MKNKLSLIFLILTIKGFIIIVFGNPTSPLKEIVATLTFIFLFCFALAMSHHMNKNKESGLNQIEDTTNEINTLDAKIKSLSDELERIKAEYEKRQ